MRSNVGVKYPLMHAFLLLLVINLHNILERVLLISLLLFDMTH